MTRSRLLFLIPLSLGLFGQEEVILDLRGTTPIKAPTRVEPPVQLRIKVQNVNDFLYSYRGSVKVDPLADTLTGEANVGKGFTFSVGAGCTNVDAAAKSFKAGLDKDFRLKTEDDVYPSIPLADSSAAWKKLEPLYRVLQSATQQEQDCPAWKEYKKTDQPLAATLAKAASGDHVYTFDASLQANGTVTVTIEEFYDEKPTKGGKRTFSFTTSSNQFFLSTGFLATQPRSRRVPTTSSTSAKPRLKPPFRP